MFKRTIASAAATIVLAAGLAGPAAAATPEFITWSNNVDVPYFDCGAFEAHGVWTVSHRLTLYLDASGTAVRDREVVEFVGAFVNPITGVSIPDSGRSTYFDTLDADGNYLTTIQTFVRHNAYLHEAGRFDFQTETFHGMSRFDDAGIAAACTALGGGQ